MTIGGVAAGLLRALAVSAGSETTNSAPRPKPSLVDRNPPAVKLGQPANDRQTDAQPTFRPMQRAIGLGEQIEHIRQQIGADADAGVPHAEHDVRAFALSAEPNLAARHRCIWPR